MEQVEDTSQEKIDMALIAGVVVAVVILIILIIIVIILIIRYLRGSFLVEVEISSRGWNRKNTQQLNRVCFLSLLM